MSLGGEVPAGAATPRETAAGTWLARDPEKARAERQLLLTTPLWMAAVGGVMLTGALRAWGDLGYLLFSVGAVAPSVLVPWLSPRARRVADGPPYWIKLHLWIAIVVFFGTYFGTHYFFDLMGMRYAFDVRWTFDAALVGRSGQRVPVFMYPLTQAYFVSYFTALVVVYRGVTRRFRLGWLGRAGLVLALSYVVAFAETWFMATDGMADLFSYAKRDRMLAIGSFGYATYFIVGLPLVARIDELGTTTVREVVLSALAACMGVLLLLEGWARVVGPL